PVDQRPGLQPADLHVVEGDVVADVGVEDQPVVGDHGDVAGLRLGDDGGRRGGVDRVEHQHLGAVGQGGVGLVLLGGGVLVGVGVQQLAVAAQGLDLGL